MKLKELVNNINLLLQDEELLRLVCYNSSTPIDDPLSPDKPDILTLPPSEKWKLINNHLMSSVNFNELDDKPISRLIYYLGYARSNSNNYLYANQELIFEVFSHYTIHNVDRRMYMICDRINELIHMQNLGGIGRTEFLSRQPIVSNSLPNGYVGFRITYLIYIDNLKVK